MIGASFDARMLIDTSRNGEALHSSGAIQAALTDRPRQRACDSWCNVRDAKLGEPPSSHTRLPHVVDAYVWVKPPGESDGCSDPQCPRFDASCASDDSLGNRPFNSQSEPRPQSNEPEAPEAGELYLYQVAQLGRDVLSPEARAAVYDGPQPSPSPPRPLPPPPPPPAAPPVASTPPEPMLGTLPSTAGAPATAADAAEPVLVALSDALRAHTFLAAAILLLGCLGARPHLSAGIAAGLGCHSFSGCWRARGAMKPSRLATAELHDEAASGGLHHDRIDHLQNRLTSRCEQVPQLGVEPWDWGAPPAVDAPVGWSEEAVV